ncbi:MAG: Holliday junction resolvase RuvX [Planctomycetota bacterium]
MRYLAVDLGDARTGLATGDDETRLAGPAGLITVPRKATEELLRQLVKAIRDHQAEVVVLGLPLNMDGTEGPRVKLTRAFGEQLAAASGAEIRYHDERLTSVEADWRMAGSGLTHKQKKQRRDALAAAALLEDYFASHDHSQPKPDPDE